MGDRRTTRRTVGGRWTARRTLRIRRATTSLALTALRAEFRDDF